MHNLVIVSHYGAGTVSVVSLAGGRLGRVVQELEYGEGCRGKSHPHQVGEVLKKKKYFLRVQAAKRGSSNSLKKIIIKISLKLK